MSVILCAIRGGEASRKTQEYAVNMAKEKNAQLIFLYVIDEYLIEKADVNIRKEIKEELALIGRLLLRMARFYGREKGVEAKILTLEGSLRGTLENAIMDNKVDLLLLGKPREENNKSYFQYKEVKKFAEEISEITGVNVNII